MWRLRIRLAEAASGARTLLELEEAYRALGHAIKAAKKWVDAGCGNEQEAVDILNEEISDCSSP